MGKDFKHHHAFLEEKLLILWRPNEIKGRAYIIVGRSLGDNSCLPILPVGSSIPARCYRVAGAVFEKNPKCAAPRTFSQAESPSLWVPGTSLNLEPGWGAGKHNHSHPCQLPSAPPIAIGGPGGFSSLSWISFQLARTVFERHRELQEDVTEGKKKVNTGQLQPRKRS